jgi:glycosyltransferase involved in cell wall biosynthesis
VLCIPSYREGFGTVVIEAAAMGLPAVGSNIYGLSDAIVNGKTGILVEPRSSKELEEALFYIITDGESRMRLGNCARQRVVDDFSSEFVNKDVVKEYVKLLAQTRDN